jgi:hypothetical protein
MTEAITIPARFNGPVGSGNGGYSCGVFAAHVEGPAEVSLRRPVPLDTRLDVVPGDDGSIRVLNGDELVAEARPAPAVDPAVPGPVSVEDARRASERYRAPSDGIFSRCFVCGLDREETFEVFAGAVDGAELVASTWTPPGWSADADGAVRPEFVWAALDCPTYFAVYQDVELPLSMLARQSVRLHRPVVAGAEQVVIAWPVESDGHKHHAGAAVLSADGETLATARALLIEPRTQPAGQAG